MIYQIRKRDGRIENFDKEKITAAIFKAAQAVGGTNEAVAEKLTDEVVERLEKNFTAGIPSVEDVQDAVERFSSKTAMPAPPRLSSCIVRSARKHVT